MTEVAEAQALILERMNPFPAGESALDDCVGAVLRETVHAERDQPPFDRVTMDGIAIDHDAWKAGCRGFRIAGTQGAGCTRAVHFRIRRVRGDHDRGDAAARDRIRSFPLND